MEKNKIFEKVKRKITGLIFWIKKHHWEFLLIVLILATGSFLRLYKIGEYMTFLGDEGRDAIIVRRLLVDKDLILIGPGTSIGNMYLGPLYYYMMAPALLLAKFSPVGPAVGIAILGVVTIFLIYLISREWFGIKASLTSSFLYAIAPTVIIYSRSSWNPNIMPFFSLICIYSLWRVWKKDQFFWLIVLSVSFAFCLQSHYLALLLLPVFGLFYFLSFLKVRIGKEPKDTKKYIEKVIKRREFFKYSAVSFLFFVFLMSPLVIFDYRHGWRNFSSMEKFFTERENTVSARPWTSLPKIPKVAENISTRLLAGRNSNLGKIILAVLSIPSLILVMNRKKTKENEQSAYVLIFVWIFISLIGLGLYKQEIYDHYLGFLFPAPFLLIGGFIQGVFNGLNKFGKYLVLFCFGVVVYFNFLNNPLKHTPNRQMQRSIDVAKKIKEEYNNKPFNLAVLSDGNYEDGYQYFLEKMYLPVIDIDAQKSDETIKDQLFVVCELPEDKCDPTHSPKTQVANFGWSKIEDQWMVSGVILYKLVHTK